MTFWAFLDRNGFGVGTVTVVLILATMIGVLVYTGKVGGGPTLCTVPCSEVRAR